MQQKDACGCSGVVVVGEGQQWETQARVRLCRAWWAMVWSLGFNLGPVGSHWEDFKHESDQA